VVELRVLTWVLVACVVAGLTTLIVLNAPGIQPALGVEGGVGLGVGIALGLLPWSFMRRTRPEPAQTAPAAAPVIAEFERALRMLEDARAAEAVARLERVFRTEPATLVTFLKDPAFQSHRNDPHVRALLVRYQRDHEARLWTGYA
jgi:hypothetical protein